MPEYRRSYLPGGTYFFTVALADRRSDRLVQEIALLRAAVARTRLFYPFRIDAWVVLPEHMHAVWTLPDGDAAYSLRWTLIKKWFSAAIPVGETRSPSRAAQGERGIWQRRFWEHTVRDAGDFARHIDYIHFNPVKHGLVARAIDWPFSSFGRAVARGDYPAEWAQGDDDGAVYGEVGAVEDYGRRLAGGGGVRKGTPPYASSTIAPAPPSRHHRRSRQAQAMTKRLTGVDSATG